MSPEQEDARWALLGKPLMREWEIYKDHRLDDMDTAYKRWAAAVREHGVQLTPESWGIEGCIVNGVLYPYTFGVAVFEGDYDD